MIKDGISNYNNYIEMLNSDGINNYTPEGNAENIYIITTNTDCNAHVWVSCVAGMMSAAMILLLNGLI